MHVQDVESTDNLLQAPIPSEGSGAVRVLFIHPAFPNQFTAIAERLNEDLSFDCTMMVHEATLPAVRTSDVRVPHVGFTPDPQQAGAGYPPAHPMESGLRNARGIMDALIGLGKAGAFDVVVGHAGFGGTVCTKALLGCATVAYVELPGYHASAARPEFPFRLDHLIGSAACEALNYAGVLHADVAVAPSEHAKRLYPPELHPKIRVQMEGFDAEHVPTGGSELRTALGLPADRKLVGFFGRTLEAVRGFDIFVRAAKQLHERDASIRFVVIGDERTIYGNEGIYLNGRSLKQTALAQAGMADELFHWYPFMPYDRFRKYAACLDLAILPIFEGAANWNLFEAMACGLPILASNRGFVPEAIRSGREGILLDPEDVEGFARAAHRLLRDPVSASVLGGNARERIRSRFSLDTAVDGYGRIIHEAVVLHRTQTCRHGWRNTSVSRC